MRVDIKADTDEIKLMVSKVVTTMENHAKEDALHAGEFNQWKNWLSGAAAAGTMVFGILWALFSSSITEELSQIRKAQHPSVAASVKP